MKYIIAKRKIEGHSLSFIFAGRRIIIMNKRKQSISIIMFIILFCFLIDLLCIIYANKNYHQWNIESESLFGGGSDFIVLEDGSVISNSDDPWFYYTLPDIMDVKTVKIDIDSVSIQDTWAEVHFILEDGRWEHRSFNIHNGVNQVNIRDIGGLKRVKDIRFDLVNIRGVTISVNDIIINDMYMIIINYHILSLMFGFSIFCIYILYYNKKEIFKNAILVRIDMKGVMNKICEKWFLYRKPFLILIGMYTVGISAILRANFNYIDDMGRAAKGYRSWDDYSRYLSNILSSFIHADSYVTDVSPLPQIIAVMILAITGMIILYIISGSVNCSLNNIIALIPLGLSPYFLECISYKFDSPYMALSILASVCPLLLYECNKLIYIGATILGVLAMCTSYQASAGVYPMLVVLLCMKQWSQGDSNKKVSMLAITSCCGYLIGLIIFKVFILHSGQGYSSDNLLPASQLLPIGFVHLREYFLLIWNDFKRGWIVLIILLIISFLFVIVRDSTRNKIVTFLLAIITILSMMILAFGVYPFLESPLYAPRGMYGFGIFIVCIGVYIANSKKVFGAQIVNAILGWCFFTFSYTYGNALYVQSNYVDFRINMVISDLNDLEVFNSQEEKDVKIVGSCGYSPVLMNMPQDYQILYRLVPITFRGDWSWGQCGFYNYYGLKNISTIWNQVVDVQNDDLPVIQDTMYHTIKGQDNYIVVELK